MYENLKEELAKDELDQSTKTTIAIMKDREPYDYLRYHCTDTRWGQWRAGKITIRELKEFTVKLVKKRGEREAYKKFEALERIAEAPDLLGISICVEFSREHNPTATCDIHTADGYYQVSGYAAGYGYDKESSAVATALNKSDSVMKLLYDYKEARLAEGETDRSPTLCTGHDNRNIIAYGAGYNVLPYFEGAVGVNCFWNIFNLLGFRVHCNYTGRRTNFYQVESQ